MTIIAVLFTAFACLLGVVVPWIGVLVYYLFSIGQMQTMWAQDFGEARVSLSITAAVLVGLIGATAIKLVNYRVLLYPHSILMLILCIWVNLSVPYSDYLIHVDPVKGQLSQADILETFNKIIFFYFIAVLLIDTRKKLEWLIYTFALIVVYYTYWANKVYLTGEFWLFGDNGRLGGMPKSVYIDENYLAMLYVLATPVLYYIGVARSHVIVRYGIWMIIPLSWHALFLTGSRGGLLSVAVVCIYIFFRSYNKKASIGIIVGLIIAVIYQSGLLLNRVDDTIEDANQVESSIISEEEALDPRLVSWKVGFTIMQDYPIFGVGVANFIMAFPDYSNTKRHVAHNTFVQFAANCGVITGLIYLWFFWMRFRSFIKKKPPDAVYHGGLHRDYLEDLLSCFYLGLFVIAIFLDLMIYEILYMTFVMGFAKYRINRVVVKEYRKPKNSIYRFGQKEQQRDDETEIEAEPRTSKKYLPGSAS